MVRRRLRRRQERRQRISWKLPLAIAGAAAAIGYAVYHFSAPDFSPNSTHHDTIGPIVQNAGVARDHQDASLPALEAVVADPQSRLISEHSAYVQNPSQERFDSLCRLIKEGKGGFTSPKTARIARRLEAVERLNREYERNYAAAIDYLRKGKARELYARLKPYSAEYGGYVSIKGGVEFHFLEDPDDKALNGLIAAVEKDKMPTLDGLDTYRQKLDVAEKGLPPGTRQTMAGFFKEYMTLRTAKRDASQESRYQELKRRIKDSVAVMRDDMYDYGNSHDIAEEDHAFHWHHHPDYSSKGMGDNPPSPGDTQASYHYGPGIILELGKASMAVHGFRMGKVANTNRIELSGK